MKLNFWQWIGLIIVVIALVLIVRRETAGPAAPQPSLPPAPAHSPEATTPPPATLPAP